MSVDEVGGGSFEQVSEGGHEATWLRSHVQLLLQQYWEVPSVVVDTDGDVPFRIASSAGWVSVRAAGGMPCVTVWAVAAHGVPGVKAVLAELNEINACRMFAKASWRAGTVTVEYSLPGPLVMESTLGPACDMVGAVADEIGTLIAAVHGGATPHPVETGSSAENGCGPDEPPS